MNIFPFKDKRKNKRGECTPIASEIARVIFPCVIRNKIGAKFVYCGEPIFGGFLFTEKEESATRLHTVSALVCFLKGLLKYRGFKTIEIVCL